MLFHGFEESERGCTTTIAFPSRAPSRRIVDHIPTGSMEFKGNLISSGGGEEGGGAIDGIKMPTASLGVSLLMTTRGHFLTRPSKSSEQTRWSGGTRTVLSHSLVFWMGTSEACTPACAQHRLASS